MSFSCGKKPHERISYAELSKYAWFLRPRVLGITPFGKFVGMQIKESH